MNLPAHGHNGKASGTTTATGTVSGTGSATATSTQAVITQTPGSDAGIGLRTGGTASGFTSPPDVDVTLDNMSISNLNINELEVVTYNTGAGHSFDVRMPYLGMKACIAATGIYPDRG